MFEYRKRNAVSPARRPTVMITPSQTMPVASTSAAGAPNGASSTTSAASRTPHATLRDRHDRGNFGEWPREEPHTQRKYQSASSAQQSGEQNIGALHASSHQPPKDQPPGTARYRADGVAKLREPAADSNGASAQERLGATP